MSTLDNFTEDEVKNAQPKGKKKFRINCFFGFRWVTIGLDSNRKAIEQVFTCGNCHSFALAVNKLTGWPLMACFYNNDEDGMARHVFVQNDRGNFVDATGEKTPEEFASQWRGDIKPINRQVIGSWVRAYRTNGAGYIPTRVKDALPYAKKVLESL